jgi:outer membrane receptor protein involved in Fe transport
LTFTSITAWRKSKARANFDVDFTSADLLNGANNSLEDISTFTQEFRVNANFVDRVNVLLGGYYFHENIKQNGDLTWGSQARTYANALVSGLSGGTQSIPGLEGLFGTLTGNPARYIGQFFAAGQGLAERDTMSNDYFSIFSQVDFKVTDRLTLTGGINYTNDKKNYSINVTTTDVFASLNLPALRNAATNAGIAQTVGGLLGIPGGFANAQQIGAFAGANPAAFQQIQAGAAAATLPLLGLAPLQFLPPILGVPNAVEPGKTHDDKFTYTARLAYQFNDRLNAYFTYATGFKASSVNLSRDSRPPIGLAGDLAAAGVALPNQTYGSRTAAPENSEVFELGLKGNWHNASANIAVFYEDIKGFQQNLFTGTGFILTNAGKESVYGVEFDGMVRPVRELTFGLSMTFLHPRYNDYTNSPWGDASGFPPAGIPRFSGTFSVDYDHPLANNDHIILHGDFHHESRVEVVEALPGFFVTNPIAGTIINAQPGIDAAKAFTREVNELNASLTYAMHNGIEFAIWGRNITDNRYITAIFDSPAQAGSVSAYTNQPRTWGGTIRYRW